MLGSIKKQVLTSAVSTTPRKKLWCTYLLTFYYNERCSAYLLTYSLRCNELRTQRTYLHVAMLRLARSACLAIYFLTIKNSDSPYLLLNSFTTWIFDLFIHSKNFPSPLFFLFCFCIEPSTRHWRRCTPLNATVYIKRRWTLKDDKTNREKHAMSRIDVHWRSMMCICVPLRKTASHFGMWSAISYFGVPFSILTCQIIY